MAKFCGLLRVYVLYNRDLRVVIFQKDAVCTWIHHHIPHLHQYHQSLITNRPLYLRWSICCLRFSSWLLDHLIYLKFRIMVFCYQNCSSDREKLLKFEAGGREFSKILRSLEQFIQTERSEQFLVTECFFNLFLEVSHIYIIN